MQYAIEDIQKAFTTKTGVDCEIILSSSGKLTAQIMEGAPFDVFLSADMTYPELLYKNGFATEPPRIYARGMLVLLTTTDEIELSMAVLTSNNIENIALANPKIAPYGKASLDVMESLGILQEVEAMFVYGESIAQTNQFIISGASEVGFTAKSVVLSPNIPGNGKWLDIDTTYYDPIDQGIILVDNKGTQSENAEAFYQFIFENECQEILLRYGYLKAP